MFGLQIYVFWRTDRKIIRNKTCASACRAIVRRMPERHFMFMLDRKRTLRRSSTMTFSPVRGLRPMCSGVRTTENIPKPEMSTFSLFDRVRSAIPSSESTTLRTSSLDIVSCSATALISCDLFITIEVVKVSRRYNIEYKINLFSETSK